MSSRSPYSLLKIYKHFLKAFELEKNKKNIAKHQISKSRPNSRWMPKGFYRLKLVNLIFLQFFFYYLNWDSFTFFIKKFFS
jgi:hypothetical protein